jgi:hypothetical protein
MTATMPTIQTAGRWGVYYNITGAGTSSQLNGAVVMNYNAGYTGSSGTYAEYSTNGSGGTGINPLSSAGQKANFAIKGRSAIWTGTTGTEVGINGEAYHGLLNIGVLGNVEYGYADAQEVGVLGLAVYGTSGENSIGGYFGLYESGIMPTLGFSSALVANNGTSTAPILIGQDNSTTVFTIADGGKVAMGTSSAPTYNLDIFSSGTTTLLLDSVSATQGSCLIMKDRTNGVKYGIVISNGVIGTTTATDC